MGTVEFDGRCSVCGWEGVFALQQEPIRAPRDFRCGGCRAPVVFQAEAAAILDEFERGDLRTLDELVDTPDFRRMAVLHIGRTGPVRDRLKRLPDYEESALDDTRPLGAVLGRDPLVTNQDHQRLTHADRRFDLIVSSHVLEHVPDWRAALREAHRTLKPGGRYIFSIPVRRLRGTSTARAEIVDGEVVHRTEPRFHNSPERVPALVFTDFGRDLVDELEAMGFVVSVRRTHRIVRAADVNFVVVAAKPHQHGRK